MEDNLASVTSSWPLSSPVHAAQEARKTMSNRRGNSMRHILVTGGTGTLGSHVVARLLDAGCAVRVLSRSTREAREGIEFVAGDLTTGEGVEAAVERVETIIHCAGSNKGDEVKALNLVRAAARVG